MFKDGWLELFMRLSRNAVSCSAFNEKTVVLETEILLALGRRRNEWHSCTKQNQH